MFRKIILSTFAVFSLAIAGCEIQNKLEERQDDAMDLSGEYATSSEVKDKDLEMGALIVNENERHDIVVDISRNSVTSKEKAFFLKHGVGNNEALQYVKSLQFGLGRNSWGAVNSEFGYGADAVSLDGGVTTNIFVCTLSEETQDGKWFIQSCIHGKRKKDSNKLVGELRTYMQKIKGKLRKENDHYLEQKISLTSNSVSGLQIFGEWTGDVHAADKSKRKELSKIQPIKIKKVSTTEYELAPGQQTIRWNGQDYVFAAERFEIEDLKKNTFPLVSMSFAAPDGSRLLVFAQIFGIGNMSGSIVELTGAGEYPVASFTLKRK